MADLHLRHLTAVTMDDDDSLLDDATLVVSGSRLAYVGPSAGAPPPQAGDRVVDACGKVALPGLVNAHTHLAMTLFRGASDDLPLAAWLQQVVWPTEKRLTPDDVYWASLLGIAEMLRAGVTTFNDMYWHVEAVADAVREGGVRGCLSGVVIGIAADADAMLARAIERVRTMRAEGHPRIVPMFGPHAPYTVPAPMLRRIVEEAAALGVGIHTHLSETTTEVEESLRRHGVPPIACMDTLGLFSVPVTAAHCVHPTEAEVGMLAASGVCVAHCPTSNLKLGSGVAPVPALLAAGVTVGLGTDGAGSNNTLDVMREMRLAALLHKVNGETHAMSAVQALRMATRGGAEALHLPEIGVLQAGKLADVVLFDFDRPHLAPAGRVRSHLVYAAYAHDAEMVIVHGEVLMEGGRLRQLDEERIRAKVNESAARLFG